MIKLKHWFRSCEIKLLLEIEATFILDLTFEKKKILKIYCCCSPFYFHAFQKVDRSVSRVIVRIASIRYKVKK